MCFTMYLDLLMGWRLATKDAASHKRVVLTARRKLQGLIWLHSITSALHDGSRKTQPSLSQEEGTWHPHIWYGGWQRICGHFLKLPHNSYTHWIAPPWFAITVNQSTGQHCCKKKRFPNFTALLKDLEEFKKELWKSMGILENRYYRLL